MKKPWYKSRTLWLGAIICLGGVAEYLNGVPAGASVSTIIAGVMTVIIRFLTKQSIGK